MTPKDFFLHLASMATLYFGVGALIWLLFTVIDYKFQTGLYRLYGAFGYSSGSHPISWPVASLIVLTPLYLILNWVIVKDFMRDATRRSIKIYKWLVYLTLFVAAAIMVGDLITILYRFLDGQTLTTSFVLKVLALLLVSALVFSYYFLELREKITKKTRRVYAVIAVAIILLSIIAGFAVIGSPYTQRLRRADAMRIQNLSEIQWQIVNYWQSHGALPRTLVDLNDDISGFVASKDPESNKDYEYAIVGAAKFKLCANFALASEGANLPETSMQKPLGAEDNWKHGAGNTCFERKIDTTRYPILLKR